MPARFEELLRRTIGLDPASVGPAAIDRAVRSRMAACRSDDPVAYRALVETSPTELQALIEAVVVSETWFFRAPEAFEAMAVIAREQLLASGGHGTLRGLSLACATGEEPYSMAMALLDAGLPPDRFRIDAVDISAEALLRAARATYSRNAFRGRTLDFRERHFTATTEGWRLGDAVRRQVSFRQGNLLDPAALPGPAYDFVFCRNVLIYLDPAARQRTLSILAARLAPAGYVFVGASEASVLLQAGFVPAREAAAGAFRRKPPSPPLAEPPAPAARRPARPPPVPPAARMPAAPRAAHPRAPPPRSGAADLEAICALADDGRLVDAARRCEEHLRTRPPSAEAHHLLGLIRDAAGDLPGAADCYRKALYLEPGHQQALAHLALVHERRGEVGAARRVTERLRRLDRQEARR